MLRINSPVMISIITTAIAVLTVVGPGGDTVGDTVGDTDPAGRRRAEAG